MGSGKSYLLQMMPLKIIDDPNSRIIMFRRTTPQIVGQGGIYDTAKMIYNKLPEKLRPRWRDKPLEAIFPNGAKIKWSHMETENDRFNIQGLQFTMIGVDEGTQFTWTQLNKTSCLS